MNFSYAHENSFTIMENHSTFNLIMIIGVRIRIQIRMDSPILDPLDPDPHSLGDPDPDPGYLFCKYGDFYIIDQISQKPCYFFTVNLSQ